MAEKKPTTKKKATNKKPTTKKEKKEVVETGAMEEFLNANIGKIAKVSKVEDIDGVPTVTIVPDNHLDSIECTLTVMPIEPEKVDGNGRTYTQECVDKMMEESRMMEVNVDMDENFATITHRDSNLIYDENGELIGIKGLKGHPDPVGELGVDATKELENVLENELSKAFWDRNTIAEQVLDLDESNKNATELMEEHLTDIDAKEIDDKVLQEHEELIEGKEEIKQNNETTTIPIVYVTTHMGISYD